jgi:hypothetical protein
MYASAVVLATGLKHVSLKSRVADPHLRYLMRIWNPDSGSSFYFKAVLNYHFDADPNFHSGGNSDPNFHSDADPDPLK